MAQGQYSTADIASAPQLSPYAKPGPYLTKLGAADESNFQSWVKANKVPFDPSPTADYDMRGYWQAQKAGGQGTKISQFDGMPHFPDTFKTPYHKTFSNESKYATADAPKWQGERLVDKSGNIVADETPGAPSAAGKYSAADIAPPSTSDHGVRDQLKSEGFLDSMWNSLKSPFTAMASLFNGDYQKQHEADYARMEELQKSGTKEQKRDFAKEVLLKHIPLASTIYKAAQGNYAGAAGDVAGMAVLGGAYKAAEAAPGVVRVASDPAVVRAGLRVLPKGAAVADLLDKVKEARGGATPAPAAEPATPGQVYAKSIGADWDSLSPSDKGLLEHTAKAQQNVAQQATAAPPARPQGPVQPPAGQPPSAAAGKSLADMLRDEMASNRAPVQAAPPPPAPLPMKPFSWGADPFQKLAPVEPIAPPVAPPPETEVIQPPKPAVAEAGQKPMTTPQAEAAMARHNPPPTEAPGRSPYTANGDLKSPQLRGQESYRANVDAKAQRWAAAIDQAYPELEPGMVGRIPPGKYTAEQIRAGATPGMENIADDLISKGILPAGEKVPGESMKLMISYLKKIKSQRIAQQLADEMKASGTLQ